MAPKGPAKAKKIRPCAVLQRGRHLRRGVWGVKARKPRSATRPRASCSGTAHRLHVRHAQNGGFFMRAILDVILLALQIYVWLLIASAVLSWLIAFNVVNTRNQFVHTMGEFLYRITEPALRPIRNMMPNLGGIDISPVILILLIFLIERIIIYYIYPYPL